MYDFILSRLIMSPKETKLQVQYIHRYEYIYAKGP